MSDTIVRINNLYKSYKLYEKPIDRLKESLNIFKRAYHKEYFALNDINLEIKKGEILGIIGTNGSGKSTLLKIITGVLNKTSGECMVNGTISALLELGTGFNMEYTGMQNIYLYGTMLNKKREEIDKEVQEIIDFADIGDFIYQPVKTYSSGMFARLAFAVAINVKPDILIVDEILSVGDLKFQIKCMEKMSEMMTNGTTVLFVNHDINAIKRFCTKALWLHKGKLVEYGDVHKVTDNYLDFLKLEEINEYSKKEEVDTCNINSKNESNLISKINSFKIYNAVGNEITKVGINTRLYIEVVYTVYNTDIKEPVLGVSIHSIGNEYYCGLNTLLDNISIPWEYGVNKFTLEYTHGVLALGGKYYFDVALFEKTATVPIEYIAKVKEIEVISNYVAEGKYVIPHQWKED